MRREVALFDVSGLLFTANPGLDPLLGTTRNASRAWWAGSTAAFDTGGLVPVEAFRPRLHEGSSSFVPGRPLPTGGKFASRSPKPPDGGGPRPRELVAPERRQRNGAAGPQASGSGSTNWKRAWRKLLCAVEHVDGYRELASRRQAPYCADAPSFANSSRSNAVCRARSKYRRYPFRFENGALGSLGWHHIMNFEKNDIEYLNADCCISFATAHTLQGNIRPVPPLLRPPRFSCPFKDVMKIINPVSFYQTFRATSGYLDEFITRIPLPAPFE